MKAGGPIEDLLRDARKLVTLGTSEEILDATCRELLVLTSAKRVVASCTPPNQTWDHAIQLERDAAGTRRLTNAARSALFAIHRRLSQLREITELQRSAETETIFKGLGCAEPIETLLAVPIVHRTGRLFGVLLLVDTRCSDAQTQMIRELTQLTTVALENAQRLAFARRDQERLLLIAEATNDALYDWNFDSRDFWWGGGIVKLFGDSEPVQNTPRWKLERIHADDRERVRQSLEAARMSNNAAWTCEYRFMRSDGTYCDIEDRGFFVRETDGRAFRMIGSMRDVTAMKALLAREQNARREAESASRAKDEFLAMLGHELRNPLAPIVTGLQLMRLRASNKLGKELNVLERQAQHLIRLVDDLLDISRIAHAKIELKKERIELATVVASALETASPLIQSRMHTLEVNVASRGLEIDADRARLAQAIGNLLNNAAKYTEPGGTILITARREAQHIALSVRDTGIGIDPDMLPTVFTMFVQETQALDRAQGGLGLGLTIVRSMVELHGGSVEARSAGRGLGSEFTIRIPPAVVAAKAAPVKAERRVRRSPGRRILVVDDNVDAADLLSMMLERMGNTTRVAHDASAALQLIDDFAPELAVLDIGLPVMDGYELARLLREHPVSKSTRLIALSGYGQPSDRERSAGAGFDAHLVKPIAVETLEAVIDKLVM